MRSAPASANAMAQALPIPFPAPVTKAVLFFKLILNLDEKTQLNNTF